MPTRSCYYRIMSVGETDGTTYYLSLPPRQAQLIADTVGAPFSAALLKSDLHWQRQARVLSALLVDEGPFTLDAFRCLGISPDPLTLLPIMVQKQGPDADQVATALTRLLDSDYRGRPWAVVLQSLYLTSCPACWRPTMALSYQWQGHPPVMVDRHVQCDVCGYEGDSPVIEEDRKLQREIEPGRSLTTQMMNRLSLNPTWQHKADPILGFYTPRNLWALWQSIRIVDDLDLDTSHLRALKLILLIALWSGSNINDQAEILWQPTLRRPYRFREYNLWRGLHLALLWVQSLTAQAPGNLLSAQDVTGDGENPAFWLAQRWPSQVGTRLPVPAIDLALINVPPLTPLYWMLRFVWSGWLFGEGATKPLRPLLEVRRTSATVLQELLAKELAEVVNWIAPNGRLLLQWRWRGEQHTTYAVSSAVARVPDDLVVAQVDDDEWVALANYSLHDQSDHKGGAGDWRRQAEEITLDILRTRAEPVTFERLAPHLQCSLQGAGSQFDEAAMALRLEEVLDPQNPPQGTRVLSQAGSPWQSGDRAWWWLEAAPHPWKPYSDQVEIAVLALLRQAAFSTEDKFMLALTASLPAHLPPDRPWLDALLASYCVDRLHPTLREADLLAERERDIENLVSKLTVAGERFRFSVDHRSHADVETIEWRQDDTIVVIFAISFHTAVTSRLWHSRVTIPGQKCFLVLPGGRSGLVQWRIGHQPLWGGIANQGALTFVKFDHLRMLLGDMDMPADRWLDLLSLDPITTAQPEQLRLL